MCGVHAAERGEGVAARRRTATGGAGQGGGGGGGAGRAVARCGSVRDGLQGWRT